MLGMERKHLPEPFLQFEQLGTSDLVKDIQRLAQLAEGDPIAAAVLKETEEIVAAELSAARRRSGEC